MLEAWSRLNSVMHSGVKKKLISKLLFLFKKSDRYMFFFKIPVVFLKINLWK